jgi:hypothetical protein
VCGNKDSRGPSAGIVAPELETEPVAEGEGGIGIGFAGGLGGDSRRDDEGQATPRCSLISLVVRYRAEGGE